MRILPQGDSRDLAVCESGGNEVSESILQESFRAKCPTCRQRREDCNCPVGIDYKSIEIVIPQAVMPTPGIGCPNCHHLAERERRLVELLRKIRIQLIVPTREADVALVCRWIDEELGR